MRVFENAGATAVDIWDSWVAVTHSRVEDNDATGFRTYSVNLDLSRTAIARNRGTGLQIAGPSANVTLQHCEIRDNDASDPEFPRIGGLSIGDTNRVWVLDCVIADNRDYFGEVDPFGDFDLIFGAAKLNMKITEIPIRYADRTYGETQISRFRDGWELIKMVVFAWRKLKAF